MFQKKVIEKYLSLLDRRVLKNRYELFCSIFSNKEKQENIRASKEEQYQEGFIRDLFCAVLGYTIKPEPNYNILTELKNDVVNKSNSKKSDAAIVLDENVKAVIELKGTDTIDLDKVAFQAFSYKNFHKNCKYVIISNFERLRFYVETQSDFIEFNLFNLSEVNFNLLYLLLALPQIQNDIPLKLQNETQSEEKAITNNFYTDYSTFKRQLFEDLCENNSSLEKLLLFKKTQKLLDRLLFIMFCEDRNLLPANSIIGIIDDYQKLKEMGYYQPLYNVFKTFFDRIDKGYTNDSDRTKDIFAYNGGLFKTDEILDSVKVGDDVLYIHSKRLANYDFESQISVDILGHIFENSLTEIEEIQTEIVNSTAGESLPLATKDFTTLERPCKPVSSDSVQPFSATPSNGGHPRNAPTNISKRKKDGVFYTPQYITKYIVQNTIGALCEAKRKELNINDASFAVGKKRKTATLQELDKRLEEYRAYLLNLKILDPACGSGAFLIAALQELKNQHAIIDLYYSNIHQNELNFTQIENSILENNLYGVDINDDSIEIAKLSLWLNTAKPHRKLTTLNEKIKVGNSLIDDESVAGEKAFYWEKEFPEVFENGGFDVVIGNPPYVPTELISNKDKEFSEKKYQSAFGRINIYPLFYERGITLLKENGYLGFITPYTILKNQYYVKARKFILNNTCIKNLIDFANIPIFLDATVDSIIFILKKTKNNDNTFIYVNNISNFESRKYSSKEIFQKDILKASDFAFSNLGSDFDFKKLFNNSLEIKSIIDFKQGITTGNNKEFIIRDKIANSKKVITGADFNRYKLSWSGNYLIYDDKKLHRPRSPEIFEKDEKLLLRQTGGISYLYN